MVLMCYWELKICKYNLIFFIFNLFLFFDQKQCWMRCILTLNFKHTVQKKPNLHNLKLNPVTWAVILC